MDVFFIFMYRKSMYRNLLIRFCNIHLIMQSSSLTFFLITYEFKPLAILINSFAKYFAIILILQNATYFVHNNQMD